MMMSIVVGIVGIVIGIVNVYMWIVIINAMLSFVRPDPQNPIVIFLDKMTEPAYAMVKKMKINTNFNGIELSPLIVIVVLKIILVILSSIGN